MSVVLGISEHNGWAEFVMVGLRGTAPVVQARYRAGLRDADLPSQPYHHEALEMPPTEAQTLVERVRRAVAEKTRAALADAKTQFSPAAMVLQESPFDRLPDAVAEVLASWNLTCAADGMMYREALAEAGAELGLEVIRYPRKTNANQAVAETLGVKPEGVATLVKNLGQPLGTPWREEHRRATAMAIWALARYAKVRI